MLFELFLKVFIFSYEDHSYHKYHKDQYSRELLMLKGELRDVEVKMIYGKVNSMYSMYFYKENIGVYKMLSFHIQIFLLFVFFHTSSSINSTVKILLFYYFFRFHSEKL